MKFLKTLSIILCALSFISCDKISETLKGTEWESSSYSTYLKTIKFTSETGFLWTSFNETNGSGVYEYENPNVYIEWREDGNYYSAEGFIDGKTFTIYDNCLLYTSPSPRDRQKSRMPSSA